MERDSECVGDGDAMSVASWESRHRGSQKAEFLREDLSLSTNKRNEPKGPKIPSVPPRGRADIESDEEPEPDEPPPKKNRGLGTDGRRPDRAGQVLDAALDGLDVPAPPAEGHRDAAPSSGDRSRGMAEQRAALLRSKLQAEKSAFESTPKGNAAGTEHLGDGIAPRARDAVTLPNKAKLGRKFLGFDEANSLDYQDSLEALGSTNADRRMLLRRLSKEQPGLLSVNTMSEYRTLLFSQDGDIVPEDENSPIFLKYFCPTIPCITRSLELGWMPIENLGPTAKHVMPFYVVTT